MDNLLGALAQSTFGCIQFQSSSVAVPTVLIVLLLSIGHAAVSMQCTAV